MAASYGKVALDREAFAASVATALQNGATTARAHPLAESVDLLPAAIVGLERALHVRLPLRVWETTHPDTSPAVYLIAGLGVNLIPGLAPAPASRIRTPHPSLSPRFSLRDVEPRAYSATRVGPGREQSLAPQALAVPISLARALSRLFTRKRMQWSLR